MSVPEGGGSIRVLAGEVISRIAAGEVVERPAAVVKELIDNSLDAGSTRITVDVKDGGLKLIGVSDDGEGMSRVDAQVAFQRHATSKLVTDQDLSSIRSLGFRGEALPSVASVSKVRLVTARRENPIGVRLHLTAGTIDHVEEVAASPGTHIEVEDLFFNTPARKKYLKTPATEFSHISQVVQKAVLAWPDRQFRLRHNGHDVLEVPAVRSNWDRVAQVYRQAFLDRCREVKGKESGFRLEGYISNPVHVRTGRNPQDLFVNRRGVRNATVTHAVYDGYGSFLPKGCHPHFVLLLDVDPDRVDVNVHPTKREVRFLDQEFIHQAVRNAVRASLGAQALGTGWSLGAGGFSDSPVGRLSGVVQNSWVAPRQEPGREAGADVSQGGTFLAGDAIELASSGAPPMSVPGVAEPLDIYGLGHSPEVIPLGQIRQTFLVAQVGAELQVVDQHTAHERVLFERLQRSWADLAVASQPLLLPEPVELPPHSAVVLQQHLSDLEKLGLVLEPFGGAAFVIRAVPSALSHLDCSSLVEDLVEDLAQWNSVSSLEARVRPILATLACHSAVRAGREMALPEIKQLIEEWKGEGFPPTCPHGRRVALRLSADELARVFGRT